MKRLVMWMRARVGNDEGSALVVALIVVLAVGIMLSAVLDFAGTGLTSGIQLRNLRNVNYFAAGSVDGAINQIRGSSTTGTTGHSCPDYVPPPPASSISGAAGHTYTVKCLPQSVPGGTGVDQPNYAVLTLSNASGEGLIATGNHDLNIDGGVYSHNEISMQHQSMIINGSVSADGACSPNSPADGGGEVATTDPAGLKCNLGGTTSLDPGYTGAVQNSTDLSNLISSADADPSPTCATTGVTEFQPGYYSVQPGVLLKNFASTCAAKNNKTWWFHSGSYFFDFSGTWQIGGSPCSGPIPCADWVVGGDATDASMPVSGGTFSNWSTGSGTPKDDWDQGIAACVSDVTSTTNSGVQFEFGGASSLQTASTGGVELCGPTNAQPALLTQPDTSNQHIVFTQLQSGSTPSGPSTDTFKSNNAPSSTGPWVFVPDNSAAQVPDGLFGTTTLNPGQDATLTYGGPFRTPSRLPKGATITSASVRVYQTLTPVSGSKSPSATIDVTPGHDGASAQTYNVPNCTTNDPANPGSLPYCDVDITSTLQAPQWKDVDGVTVTYTASGPSGSGNTGAAAVDAVALVVNYTTANADTSTCTLSNSCVIWNSTVNLNAFLHGTSYVPTGEMDVEVQNRSGTIFDRGVIAATLHVNVVASSTQTSAPFQLPKGTQNGRLVLFTGMVDSDIRVRACVLYQDYNELPDGTKLAFPGYKATVQSWNVFRGSPGGSPTC